MTTSTKTLPRRLALWYAAIITVVLTAYTFAVYVFAVEEPDQIEGAAHDQHDQHDQHNQDEASELELQQLHLAAVLGVSLLLSVATAILAGTVLTRRALAPLAHIVATCRALDIGDLKRRVIAPDNATAEIGELATTLNQTLERLERSVDGLRRFTADASHEIRTPLARMQAQIELALRRTASAGAQKEAVDALAGALDDVSALARLVETLLALAHADAHELAPNARVDVGGVLRDVVSVYEPIASERGIRVRAQLVDGALWVCGHEDSLRRAITNLVDNACKFTPAGGDVSISLERSGSDARVVVADSGPGIAPEDAPHLFERFFRAEKTRAVPGVGLGLALCRDLVRAHGGDVSLVAQPVGGAAFVIALPALADGGVA